MKTPKRSAVVAAVFAVAGIAGLISAHAQETTPAADSIVALAADSQSLPQVAPASVPVRGGTFWWVYPGGAAVPTPMLPLGASGPVYGIAPDEYLVDMTGGEVLVTPHQLNEAAPGTTNAYAAAVTAQVQGLVNLITSIQTPTPTATAMTLSAKPMGGLAPNYSTSNGVPYLTITTVTNQFLITVFNSVTNQGNYYLEMTPVLGNTNFPWAIIANGSAGQTNFSLPVGQYADEFFQVLMTTNIPGQGIAVFIDTPANGATVQ